jgi:uncharacterized protein (DUF2147 family)
MAARQAIRRATAVLAGLWMLHASILPASAEQPPAPAAKAAPALEKLKGRWLRDSGGYIIEIRSVGPAGKVDAAYFNPKSIHVGKAKASQQGGTVKLLIELRDVNYPGSTYTLSYDARNDRLVGRYYQAVAGETFDVFFMRLKPQVQGGRKPISEKNVE